MKHHFYFRLVFVLLVSLSVNSYSQEKPFWNDIQKFKHQDSISMPAKNKVVFVGSSSFTRWNDLETVFKDYHAINRGFGGSTLEQANAYIHELVFAYRPKQVVIYSGENDIATGTSVEQTYDRFVTFYNNLRKGLPKANIVYISMKQSPSRMKFADNVNKANTMIKAYMSKQKNAIFIDVNAKMLDSNGAPRPELFVEDMLHMKPEGYAIWIKEITPYLKK
ncbi:GDSL-type esterase/lipase family protein [Pedobacter sp. V48]|uniref:GDSL-type esterase/lipase family protein n=1 Tax=Pedobacter sp. V48 TaxID=509635 RepID=UPI0003E58439|nr:GDSL-type esterase/lipase family protein [Pedobacter sp. V48]ETZ24232.1 hypothetical protein N824_14620 [Pedobacter sp. V48]